MKRYKLDVKRDVDADEDGYILNLPYGFRFDDDIVHVRGYDTMKELRRQSRLKSSPATAPNVQQHWQRKFVNTFFS
jgi:23S rRNA G2445 N2-methylase RlmL